MRAKGVRRELESTGIAVKRKSWSNSMQHDTNPWCSIMPYTALGTPGSEDDIGYIFRLCGGYGVDRWKMITTGPVLRQPRYNDVNNRIHRTGES